jgi:hypothetical protein
MNVKSLNLKNGWRTLGVLAVVICCLFSSCTQVEDIVPPPASVEVSVDEGSDDLTTKSDATEYCYVAQIYKNAYKHLKQVSGECSWTSYVLTAAAVARANGSNYPYNLANPEAANYRSKITHARESCVDTAYIWKLQWYGQNTDHPAYSTINPEPVLAKSSFDIDYLLVFFIEITTFILMKYFTQLSHCNEKFSFMRIVFSLIIRM